jgi:hypothetical protein
VHEASDSLGAHQSIVMDLSSVLEANPFERISIGSDQTGYLDINKVFEFLKKI